jgi:hypothetical protein
MPQIQPGAGRVVPPRVPYTRGNRGPGSAARDHRVGRRRSPISSSASGGYAVTCAGKWLNGATWPPASAGRATPGRPPRSICTPPGHACWPWAACGLTGSPGQWVPTRTGCAGRSISPVKPAEGLVSAPIRSRSAVSSWLPPGATRARRSSSCVEMCRSLLTSPVVIEPSPLLSPGTVKTCRGRLRSPGGVPEHRCHRRAGRFPPVLPQ